MTSPPETVSCAQSRLMEIRVIDNTLKDPDNGPMIIRSPEPGEAQRVSHLFRHCFLPPQAQVLVAVKERPVHRFVGGLAGWNEGTFGRFRLALQPGVVPEEVAGSLIERAVETLRAAGLAKLVCADLLTATDPQSGLLKMHHFEVMRSERFFQVPALKAIERVGELLGKFGDQIPKQWRTESIRHHQPDEILELILPYRLLAPHELRTQWNGAIKGGLDPDYSVILLEGNQPIGTLLTRRKGDWLCYDVRVVQHRNTRLRGLANLCLFKGNLDRYDPSDPIQWLEFRAGELEHRETASLAFRMGGKELPPKMVWARDL